MIKLKDLLKEFVPTRVGFGGRPDYMKGFINELFKFFYAEHGPQPKGLFMDMAKVGVLLIIT